MTAMTALHSGASAMPDPDEPSTYPSPLAELIVTEAKAANMSMRQVAARAKMKPNALEYYTKGRWPADRRLRQETSQQIADGLGIPVHRVLDAVRASIGEEDLLDDQLTTEQRVVLSTMRKADEETERFISEVTLRIAKFAERRHPPADTTPLAALPNDGGSETPNE